MNDLIIEVRFILAKFFRLGRASGCSNMPHWTRNDVLDLQRAMSMKISLEKVRHATRQ